MNRVEFSLEMMNRIKNCLLKWGWQTAIFPESLKGESEETTLGFMSRAATNAVWARKHRRGHLLSAFIVILAVSLPSLTRADIYVTATEETASTVIRWTGDLDTASPLLPVFTRVVYNTHVIDPSGGLLLAGSATFDIYSSPSPVTFGSGPRLLGTPSGSPFLFNGFGQFGLSTSYVSGGPLSGSLELVGSFASIGLDTTQQTITLSNGEFIFLFQSPGPSPAITTSVLTTGVALPTTAQSILTSAPQTALNTVNNRLFHARSQVGNPRVDSGGVASSGRHNSNFFNFGQNNGLSLAQALGFEDIPVSAEVADSEASFVLKGLTIETQIASTVAPEAKPWEVYTSGDYHAFDQDNIGAQPGFDSDTFTGTVGAEYRVNEKLNIGLAYSYLDNRTKLGGNFGRVDVEGHLATAYATYFWDDNYVDVLYSRAYFDNSLMRNVPGGTTNGTPDSMADIVNVNIGKNIDMGNGLVTGPIAGLDYTHGTIDAYTETGPAPAILAYGSRSYESLITRLGWQATKTQEVECGRLTLQGSLAWEKEHMPEADSVNAALVAFPALPFNLNTGAHPGTDWLGLGLGASLQTRSGVEVGLNYQSQLFRQDVTSHYVGAKVSVKF